MVEEFDDVGAAVVGAVGFGVRDVGGWCCSHVDRRIGADAVLGLELGEHGRSHRDQRVESLDEPRGQGIRVRRIARDVAEADHGDGDRKERHGGDGVAAGIGYAQADEPSDRESDHRAGGGDPGRPGRPEIPERPLSPPG